MFYLEKRDGLAKLGRLKLKGFDIQTPCLIKFGSKLMDEIDFGTAPYPVKKIALEIYEKLKPAEQEIRVLAGLNTLTTRSLVESLISKDLKPVYAVSAATPLTLPLLLYLGVDILDNILAISKAYKGIYFLSDFEVNIDELERLPCGCEVCRDYSVSELRKLGMKEKSELIAKHNTITLENEMEKCRILIEREELRNYVEARVKLNPELTATLRLSDFIINSISDERIEKRFPRFKRSKCHFTSVESSYRFEVRYFLKRALKCYKPETKTLLLLPCTATKPYLTSPTHREIRGRVRVNVNEIVISSPLVVPREFELVYPASNYDTPVTGQWTDEEVAFVASWLRKFIEKGKFKKIVAHVEGGYRRVVERAVEGCGCEVIYTAADGVLSPTSIGRLKEELQSVNGDKGFNLFARIFESMFEFQFEIEAEEMHEKAFRKIFAKGRYPNLVFYGVSGERKEEKTEKIARVDITTGSLDIYSTVAMYLVDKEVYTVKIADFEPKSKIFASGVVEAPHYIRPNDVVVFYNENLYGVGVAVMSGAEMMESDVGLALRIRRMWKLSS